MPKWELISFVTSSTLRFRVLIELNKSEKIPTKLGRIINTPISHISKALSELEDRNLVKCLTPSRRKSKFYAITPIGKNILTEINELTL